MNCSLCPRKCNIDRSRALGTCRSSDCIRIARAALHFGEEPMLRWGGEAETPVRSGAIFFSGCSLGCIYCQNEKISHGEGSGPFGKEISVERLAEIFKELEEKGAENIDLVSPAHYADRIREAMSIYRPKVPVIYNCSGYESIDTLKMMEEYVDFYLPDIKYADPVLAERFSHAADYPGTAFAAVGEMIRQKGTDRVLIRHLVLPLHLKNTKGVLERIVAEFGSDVMVSLLLQYTPVDAAVKSGRLDEAPELKRKLTARECERAAALLEECGIEKGYIQEPLSAASEYIPDWNLEGV